MKNAGAVTVALLITSIRFATGQSIEKNYKKAIEQASSSWNKGFNNRDSLIYYALFDSASIVISGGGSWVGLENCKNLYRNLYRRRPDIYWYNKLSQIEYFKDWHIGYEKGNWEESWTQVGDSSKSVITGKYWIMWRLNGERFQIVSATFTPLHCVGSYCLLRK